MILRENHYKSQAGIYPLTEGIFPVVKPKGITSYDVIRNIKKMHPGKKIGHGGTLDPLASGVLIIAIGSKYTKQLHNVLNNTIKTYKVDIRLGAISVTNDSEGPIHEVKHARVPTTADIKNVLKEFEGVIYQIPPIYSAVKINGTAAYKLARRGERIVIKSKKVAIDSIKIESYFYPNLSLTVNCHSGVYIRALVRDIGKRLGCGGYVVELIRTRVGEYTLQ
ncbi:tRNA pseudouridine(55) synthase TruB [Candidatus Roizmanbacteria bacterium RIFCSPHIGHO2_01_FULL_39_12b]|uniref:tRNA pseudouridine synthase B n=1 Tax=Candidatus Roizmanbacteria bacterium RIFCSPHIGHO2_01_FULL_39_12b TaxID=1802030 RepID=A0A1F7GBI0_9BACT|nr:MAG: tRNA pseudouridine(55) synthase TruB [Candidatus Roizmanbacteria bacterium RIFCSPHIGHO2_01_FULL_39_12b]